MITRRHAAFGLAAAAVIPTRALGWGHGSPNILLDPNNLSSANWPKNALTVADAGSQNPIGVEAQKITNNGTGSNAIQGNISAGANQKFKLSAIVQDFSNTWAWIALSDESTSNFGSYFNISAGTLGNTSSVGVGVMDSQSITSLGSSWFLLQVTGHFTSLKTVSFEVRLPTNNGSLSTTSGNAGIWSSSFCAPVS